MINIKVIAAVLVLAVCRGAVGMEVVYVLSNPGQPPQPPAAPQMVSYSSDGMGGLVAGIMQYNGMNYSWDNDSLQWDVISGYAAGPTAYVPPVSASVPVSIGFFGHDAAGVSTSSQYTFTAQIQPGQSMECDGVLSSDGHWYWDDGVHNYHAVVVSGGVLVLETYSPEKLMLGAFWCGAYFAVVLGAIYMVKKGLNAGVVDV